MTVLAPGTIVGARYRIERELAQGGFGAVYVAQHQVTEELVALKVLWPQVLKSKDAAQRFEFEAKIAAKLNSENIVRVLDAGFDEGLKMPFLVMELLKGKTLEAMVESEGPMQPTEALSVLVQTANALDRAHGYVDKQGTPRPIVHRDLKPENIFFARRESGEPSVKILDFGIAKILSETSKVSREAKGTPMFMAHEQLVGKAVGPASDVWALGLVAFFLMTGKNYWLAASNPDADINALFAEILAGPLDGPTDRIRALGGAPPWPAGFDRWFLRCVDREPQNRFQRAGEAMQELAVVLAVADSNPDSPLLVKARTILATRYHLSQSVTPATRPSNASIPTAVQAVSAPRLSGSSSRVEPPPMSTSAPLSTTASTQTSPVVYAALGLAFVAIAALVVVLLRSPSQASTPAAEPTVAPLSVTATTPSATQVAPTASTPTAVPVDTSAATATNTGTATGTGTGKTPIKLTATAPTVTPPVTAPPNTAAPTKKPDNGDPFRDR